MSGDEEAHPKRKKSWTRRIASILVGLAISLIVGKIIEMVSDREWLEAAKQAQAEWIETVSHTSPIAAAATYWTEVKGAYSGDVSEGSWTAAGGAQNWLFAPLIAFAITIWRFFYEGGVTALIQIGAGALAVATFNFVRSKGETILFNADMFNLILVPITVMLSASVLGFVLEGVMIGALYALSRVTGLAAMAAGATGVVGFCWLCVTKLGEKGAEHVMTPKI